MRLLGVARDSKKEARGTMTPRYHASSAKMNDGAGTRRWRGDVRLDEKVVVK